MTDLVMYDAVNVDAIPNNATMVAGYLDGGYVTWPELVRRFPHARHVSITVTGDVVADVIDVESGDASPQKAVAWARMMRSHRRCPIVYTSSSNLGNVAEAFRAEREADPFYWVADWTGVPHLYPGSVATQYASPSVPPAGRTILYDLSLVSPNWPDAAPTKGTGQVNLKLNWSSLYRVLALVGSVLGVIIGLGNQLHLPVSVRSVLVAASAGILWIEHHKVTAGTPPKPPTPPASA